jgi:hypothetical protein
MTAATSFLATDSRTVLSESPSRASVSPATTTRTASSTPPTTQFGAKNLGSGTALPNDDTAGVGPDDYTRWTTHFGETGGSGAGARVNANVPEPATQALLILAAAGWYFRRGRST